jgi:hypothetical protein
VKLKSCQFGNPESINSYGTCMPHDPNYDSPNLSRQKNTGNILPLPVCPRKPIPIAQYNTNVWKSFCNNQFKKPFLDYSVQKRVKIKFKSNKILHRRTRNQWISSFQKNSSPEVIQDGTLESELGLPQH